MRLSSNRKSDRGNATGAGVTRRSPTGSVLPFVAVSLLVIAAYLGFSIDLTRNLLCVRKAEFAADAAALYAYSMQTNSDGSYNESTAWQNIANALSEPNGAGPRSSLAWNEAPAGPKNDSGPWNTGVTFAADDVLPPVSNPADSSEKFLQLRFRRQGDDALRQIFMPTLYATSSATAKNPPNTKAEIDRRVEVVGQPASRIGAGVPRSAGNVDPLTGFACFPLAISNAQFAAAAAANAGPVQYTIDLVNATTVGNAAQPQHIKGAFINDARANSGTGGPYFGTATSSPDIDQLIGLLKYFNGQNDVSSIPPAAVERGAKVSAFDPASAGFQARQQNVLTALAQVPPGGYVIVPVLALDPSFAGANNRVLGFARLRVVRLVTTQNNVATSFSVVLDMGNSVVMRNTTCNQIACIPLITGTQASGGTSLLPPPENPFGSRIYNAADNSLSKLPRGLVLAPTISPRNLRN